MIVLFQNLLSPLLLIMSCNVELESENEALIEDSPSSDEGDTFRFITTFKEAKNL